jgi:hypothetical protein
MPLKSEFGANGTFPRKNRPLPKPETGRFCILPYLVPRYKPLSEF